MVVGSVKHQRSDDKVMLPVQSTGYSKQTVYFYYFWIVPIHTRLQGGSFSAPAGKKIQMHGKTHKYEGMGCTSWYAGLAELSQAMSEDAVQRSRWTFYEVLNCFYR
jgi:hypothetical protein